MVYVKRIRKRGVNIVVEAYAEVLFAPTGDIGVWQRRFSQKAVQFAAQEAPTNKRPRWGHYGKPLKTTFTATSKHQPGRLRIYTAIGSTSPHATYVDQGTGVFGGKGLYQAKILPPWTRGSPSLYEHTWRPPGSQARVKPVFIKGQPGQQFLDKGVRRAFAFMRARSYQVPGEGNISNAVKSFPDALANFSGATPADAGFIQSLEQWRAWRDDAFNAEKRLGKDTANRARRKVSDGTRPSVSRYGGRKFSYTRRSPAAEARRAQRSKERSQARRDEIKRQKAAKSLDKTERESDRARSAKGQRQRAEKARFIAALVKKYGAANVDMASLEFEGGYYYATVRVFTERAGDGKTTPEFKEVRGRKVE